MVSSQGRKICLLSRNKQARLEHGQNLAPTVMQGEMMECILSIYSIVNARCPTCAITAIETNMVSWH